MTLHQHGIGLAGITEIDTAQAAQRALVAQAQGSLVPRQDQPAARTPQELEKLITGFDPVSTERPTIQRKSDAIARRRRARGGVPSFEDEPAFAFFTLLADVGASLEGKELLSDQLRDGQLKRESLELRRLMLGIGVIESAAKLCKGKSAEQCRTITDSVGARFENQLGAGFTETLKNTVTVPDPIDFAALIGEPQITKALFDIFGTDVTAAQEFVLEPKNRKRLENIVDKKNIPLFISKLSTVFKAVEEKAPGATPKEYTLGQIEAGCALLPKNVCPTSGEFASARRNQAQVREVFPGLITSEVQEKGALTKAGRESIPEAAKRAGEIKKAQLEAEAGGARELEGARTVDVSEDIPLPDGGTIPKGTAITVRPVKDKPFSVTSVFVDGKPTEVEIPDALIAKLVRERKLEVPTATQRGQIDLRLRFLDDALSQLQILKRVVEDTPTGAAGEIVKALQGTYDQALTLAETVPGVDALVNITERGIAFIDSSLFEAKTPEERDELDSIRRSFLNTDLPAIPIIQEGIAIALAAASFPTTQRIPVEAIKEARKNVDLTGLFGPGRGTALAKLNTIIDRIESNKTFLGQRKTAIEQPAIKGKPVDREERKRRLLEKFGIKPR